MFLFVPNICSINMAAKRKFEDNEGHNDQIPVQTIFTFNDLCEDVVEKVGKYLPLEERAANTRTSRLMGRRCSSLWNLQKKLPSEFYTFNTKKYYYAAVLKCPNLTTFVAATEDEEIYDDEEDEELGQLEPSQEYMRAVLATSCPRIESFDGPLPLLAAYLNVLKDRNCIKSIHLTDLGDPDRHFMLGRRGENSAFRNRMKVLADYLIRLKSMTMEFHEDDRFPMNIPQFKILGQRVSGINIMYKTYQEMYQHFQPGDKLGVLEGGQYQDPIGPELPAVFAARHPKLKKIGLLNVTANNLRIINQIQYLETVELHFDENSGTDEVMELFRSFLLRHIHLKGMKIFLRYRYGRHNEVIQAICELRPGIKYLDLEISQYLHINTEYNFFDHLHQLRNLREFLFRGCTTVLDWNMNAIMPLFASWRLTKIKRVHLSPFEQLERGWEIEEHDRIMAVSKEQIKEFAEEHHRSFIFTIW